MIHVATRLPKAIIFFTFLLIILGGVVHNTESSLACPDWPLCYGQIMPKMEGGVLIEHSHRLLGSLVGFLTLLFFILTLTLKNSLIRQLRPIALLALFLVVVQGILGGITVLYKLPTIVSSTHLGLAMIFFLTINYIDFKIVSLLKTEETNDHQGSSRIFANALEFTAILLGMTYLQILLGAFMRHSGSGAACGLGMSSAIWCTDVASGLKVLWPHAVTSQVHMLHRLSAIVIAAAGLLFTVWSVKSSKNLEPAWCKRFNFFAISFVSVIVLQIALGVATVADFIGPVPTTLHLAGAGALVALLWRHFLHLKSALSQYHVQPYSFLRDLFEMSKPKLTLLVVVTTFAGILLTPEELHPIQVMLVLLSMYLIVSGAAVLNCYLERNVDAKMDRTKSRPLPAMRFSSHAALLWGVGLNIIGSALLYWQSNALTVILATLASVLYLFAYTPMKQNSAMALFVGTLPGALPSLIGWTALTNELGIIPLSVAGVMVLWQIPHFMAIAVRYQNDYKNAGLVVFPNEVGLRTSMAIAIFTSLLLMIAALGPFFFSNFSLVYAYAAAFLSALFLLINIHWGFQKSQVAIMSGAQNVFWASIAYLPLLLACMIFFK